MVGVPGQEYLGEQGGHHGIGGKHTLGTDKEMALRYYVA